MIKQTVGAFVLGLGLGAIGGLLLAPQDGRRTRAQLAERTADLYYELEARLVAVPVQDIVLGSRVRSALRSAGLGAREVHFAFRCIHPGCECRDACCEPKEYGVLVG